MAKTEKIASEVIATPKEEKLSPFLEAYKKQNPEKYEAKKARGELNGL